MTRPTSIAFSHVGIFVTDLDRADITQKLAR
jgi:hypothetical protein